MIRPLNGESEAWTCAEIMASTDPWITLGRNRNDTFSTVTHPQAEAYVAVEEGLIAGVVILVMKIPLLRGYVMGLAVRQDFRNRGIGSSLLKFAEDRILRESPNVFLCVTTFNTDAQRLYERHGYKRVGVIEDFKMDGAGEILMRKTTGSIDSFRERLRSERRDGR